MKNLYTFLTETVSTAESMTEPLSAAELPSVPYSGTFNILVVGLLSCILFVLLINSVILLTRKG